MNNSADKGGCYSPRPKAEGDNTLHSFKLKAFVQKGRM